MGLRTVRKDAWVVPLAELPIGRGVVSRGGSAVNTTTSWLPSAWLPRLCPSAHFLKLPNDDVACVRGADTTIES